MLPRMECQGVTECLDRTCYLLFPTVGDLLLGTSTEGYMVKNSNDAIPTALMIKGKFHFIGRILQLLEVYPRRNTSIANRCLKYSAYCKNFADLLLTVFGTFRLKYYCGLKSSCVWFIVSSQFTSVKSLVPKSY